VDKRLKVVLPWLTVGLLCLVAVPSAEALSIKLASGITTKIVADGSADDINMGVVGDVLYSESIGSFLVTVTNGVSNPLIGSATSPAMSLTVTAISLGAGTLTVWLTDDSFGPHANGTGARASFGGTTVGTIAYTTYQDTANSAFFDSGSPLTTLSTGSPFVPGSTSGSLAGAASYSLTQKLVITHSVGGVSALSATLNVPDGGSTAALLGSVLFAFGMVRRRFGKS